MRNIPEIVKTKAEAEGYNSISYVGVYDNAQAFSVGIKDENGNPIPMGMPTFILLKDNKLKIVGGDKGLDILLSFQ